MVNPNATQLKTPKRASKNHPGKTRVVIARTKNAYLEAAAKRAAASSQLKTFQTALT